jgi:hypothetical protein
MPEYNASPVWEVDDLGLDDLEPSELPISPELQRDLVGWARRYQATFDGDYPGNSGFQSREAESDFDRDGRRLWRRLAEELGDGARVSYFSILENSLIGPGRQ